MGLFIVDQVNEFMTTEKRVKMVDKDLKVILFLCKNPKDRFTLESASMTMCGDYFCWSYPKSEVIHLFNMSKINEHKSNLSKTRKATSAVKNAFSTVMNTLQSNGKCSNAFCLIAYGCSSFCWQKIHSIHDHRRGPRR